MPPAVDLYHVLQVVPDADPEVIRAAYRALARKHHPDSGGSDETMSMLNSAWETLCDRGQRAQYDRDRITATAQPDQHAVVKPPVAAAAASHLPSASVVDFGRYEGCSLAEIAARDSNYLEWLARTPIGRRLQPEITALLSAKRPIGPLPVVRRSRLFGRR